MGSAHTDSHDFCAVMGELDLTADDDDSGHHLEVLASTTTSHGLTEATAMFFELVGVLSAESGSDAVAYFNTGLTWLATPVWQLDGGVRIGLTGASTDFLPPFPRRQLEVLTSNLAPANFLR